jgi:hypothetical protein
MMNNYKVLFLNLLNKMIKSKALLLTIALLSLVPVFGQDYTRGNAIPFFSGHEMLEISIIADFQTILKDIGEERNEHPGILKYVSADDTLVFDIQIMTRGNFRRNPENCAFPPLRINFKKKQVRNTLFDRLDKVKLVTHCRPKAKVYQHYVMEEYLIYRTFNIITDTSYRVRPLMVNYVDQPSGKHSQSSYAFFIEPDKVLEDRLNLKEIEKKYVFQDSTQRQHVSRLAIFQYMIGNTDWAVTTLQNIKLYQQDSLSKPYAIPYDFDWSGVISTVYSRPLPKFEIETVRDRLFRGYCRTMVEIKANFGHFMEKQDEIYSLYENYELLNNRRRRTVLKYFDEFYEIINDDRKIKSEFLDNCLK